MPSRPSCSPSGHYGLFANGPRSDFAMRSGRAGGLACPRRETSKRAQAAKLLRPVCADFTAPGRIGAACNPGSGRSGQLPLSRPAGFMRPDRHALSRKMRLSRPGGRWSATQDCATRREHGQRQAIHRADSWQRRRTGYDVPTVGAGDPQPSGSRRGDLGV
jgi:hypothetical protein